MPKRHLSIAPSSPPPSRRPVESRPPEAGKDFTRVEKNLASIGFFSPSSKKIRDTASKTVRFMKTENGKTVEGSVTIVPASTFGLPHTADQDFFLAFQEIVTEQKRERGHIVNPVEFTTAQLLRLLGKKDSGFYYDEVEQWMHRMTLTGIISKGSVFLANSRKWVTDTFHVFTRAVGMGQEFEDGTVADRNYVWLSDWQLQNINNNHVFPVDLQTYSQIRNHIARALVPLLQVWLFASERQGVFTKRYEDLCEILHIKHHTPLSYIKRQLGPSLDELVHHEYLSKWALVQVGGAKRYKVQFHHGEKFRRDRRLTAGGGFDSNFGLVVATSDVVSPPETDAPAVEELTARGVTLRHARRVVAAAADAQDIVGQLEWGDHVIAQNPTKFTNPAGFYVSIVQDNLAVPASFETSRRRQLQADARHSRSQELQEKARLQLAYEEYVDTAVEDHLHTLDPADYDERIEAAAKSLKREYGLRHCPQAGLRDLARRAVAKVVREELSLQTFDEFRQGRARDTD